MIFSIPCMSSIFRIMVNIQSSDFRRECLKLARSVPISMNHLTSDQTSDPNLVIKATMKQLKRAAQLSNNPISGKIVVKTFSLNFQRQYPNRTHRFLLFLSCFSENWVIQVVFQHYCDFWTCRTRTFPFKVSFRFCGSHKECFRTKGGIFQFTKGE